MLYADLRVMLDTLINIDSIQGQTINTEYATLIKNALVECSKQDTRVKVKRADKSIVEGDLFELAEYKKGSGIELDAMLIPRIVPDGWTSLSMLFPDDNDSVIKIGFAAGSWSPMLAPASHIRHLGPDYEQIYDNRFNI